MPNPKLCAICGYRVATTRDHVPPRAIFPRPLPVQMITVPACGACNNGAHQLDERFRVYLAAVTAHRHAGATRLWYEESMRTLHANKRLMREFAASIPSGDAVVAPDGSQGVEIHWPVEDYTKVLERIVRGLFFHHYNEALGARAACDVQMLNALPEQFVQMTAPWPNGHVGEEVFTYRFGRVDQLRSFWVLQFFQSHWGTVETYPAGKTPVSG